MYNAIALFLPHMILTGKGEVASFFQNASFYINSNAQIPQLQIYVHV